jgi:hypothetical protein
VLFRRVSGRIHRELKESVHSVWVLRVVRDCPQCPTIKEATTHSSYITKDRFRLCYTSETQRETVCFSSHLRKKLFPHHGIIFNGYVMAWCLAPLLHFVLLSILCLAYFPYFVEKDKDSAITSTTVCSALRLLNNWRTFSWTSRNWKRPYVYNFNTLPPLILSNRSCELLKWKRH